MNAQEKMELLKEMPDTAVISLILTLILARRSPGTRNMIVGYFNYNDIVPIIERIQLMDYETVQAVKNAVINTAVETIWKQ
jgi:hypothetical protein